VVTRDFDPDLAIISYASIDLKEQPGGKKTKVATGLCCGTQDAFFRMADGSHSTIRYMEDEIVTVTITIN
jgi:hypothetical protein